MDETNVARNCMQTVPAERDKMRFAIQEHFAKTHRFDFRLEKDGVYKSWAVPKGIPDEPGIKRLADHELAFGNFKGIIPDGQYCAGKIEVWDNGFYELHSWGDNVVTFTLHANGCMAIFNSNVSPMAAQMIG